MFRHLLDLSPVDQAEAYPQTEEDVDDFNTPHDVEGFEDQPSQLNSLFPVGVLEDVGRLFLKFFISFGICRLVDLMILSIEDNEVLERDDEYHEHTCAIEPLRILLVPRVADHALHELEVRKKNCNFEEGQDDLHVDLGSIDLQYWNQCKRSGDDQNRIN